MKLDQISAFVTLVQVRSFKKTAEQLCLTTSAVSKKINALEESTGLVLLKRTTRSFEVTSVGYRFYEKCLRIKAEVNQANNMIADLTKEPEGSLYIKSTIYLGKRFILPRLNDFCEHYPKVHIHLDLADRVPDVEKEKVDIFFGITIAEFVNFQRKMFLDSRQTLVASKAYLDKNGVPHKPEDLMQHYYVALAARQHLVDEVLFESKQVVPISPGMTVNTSEALYTCACNGVGIVNLIDFHANEGIKAGKLVPLLEDYPQIEMPVYCYYREGLLRSTPIEVFADFFLRKN